MFVVNNQYILVVCNHPVYYQDQTQEEDYPIITIQSLIITAVPLWILNLTTPATSFPRRSGTQLHPVSPARSGIWDCKIWALGLQYLRSGISIPGVRRFGILPYLGHDSILYLSQDLSFPQRSGTLLHPFSPARYATRVSKIFERFGILVHSFTLASFPWNIRSVPLFARACHTTERLIGCTIFWIALT